MPRRHDEKVSWAFYALCPNLEIAESCLAFCLILSLDFVLWQQSYNITQVSHIPYYRKYRLATPTSPMRGAAARSLSGPGYSALDFGYALALAFGSGALSFGTDPEGPPFVM